MAKTVARPSSSLAEAIPTTVSAQAQARTAAHTIIHRRGLVKMRKPSKRSGLPASVSFTGVTAVTPEFAEAMASALTAAAKAARELNIPKRDYFDIYNPDGYYGI